MTANCYNSQSTAYSTNAVLETLQQDQYNSNDSLHLVSIRKGFFFLSFYGSKIDK